MSTRIPNTRQANVGATKSTATNQTTARKRIDRTQASEAVSATKNAYAAKQQYLYHLQQRPHLIAALSDEHKSINRLMMASNQLKDVVKSLLKIKQIAEQGNFTPDLMNQVDIEKKAIVDTVNQQLYGEYILDSSFAPIAEFDQGIEFTIAGLDLTRERLTNELVTLYINQRMVPLAFDRTERDTVLFQQFSLMFAYSNLRLRLGENKEFIINMPDSAWRRWDLNVHISGQGGRYSEGQPVTIPVTPTHATIESVTMLDMLASDASARLDKVIERVNVVFSATQQSLKTQQQSATELIDLCTKVDSDIGEKIKTQFTNHPEQSLRAIQRHYIGPNRDNVVGLMRGY